MKNKDGNNKFVLICLLFALVAVLLFPKVYSLIESKSLPEVEKVNLSSNEEEKKIDQDLLDSLHYPIMRLDSYSKKTYYSLDKFTINDMSNNDILVNAFLDIYSGNMSNYNKKVKCTNSSKKFDAYYIQLRVKNILGKNVKYSHSDFFVPESVKTNYVGSWIYDKSNSIYIYEGLCDKNTSSTKYYDLEQYVKAEFDNNDVLVYYYVGFAEVKDGKYTIYSDANMKNKIGSGNFENINKLKEAFNNLDTKDKKAYKYTFKDTLCSYSEYCLYKGEWINGI